MTDVVIHHLRVRIVRKGSLFWGDDPRRLARRAITAVPEILARQLGELGLGDEAVEIQAPVQLSLRGSLASLQELLGTQEGTPELRNLVQKALEEALGPTPYRAPERPVRQGPPPPRAPGSAPLGELLQIHLRGELAAALAGSSLEVLEAYHRALLESPAPGGAARPLSAEDRQEAQRFIEAFAAGLEPAASLEERLRQRLLAAVSLAASTGLPPFDADLRVFLDRSLPLTPELRRLGRERALVQDPSQQVRPEEGAPVPSPHGQVSAELPEGADARHDPRAAGPTHSGGERPSGNASEPPAGEPGHGAPHEASPISPDAHGPETEPGARRRAGAQGPEGTGGGADGKTARSQEQPPGVAPSRPTQAPRAVLSPGSPAPLPLPAPQGGRAPAPRPGAATRSTSSSLSTTEERPLPGLPLLVAGVLLRSGIVARVVRHLAETGCAEELPLWSAALMFKLGPRPVRGWMYPPELWTNAALLSGSNLFSGEGLVLFADSASVHWPELSAALLPVLAPKDTPLVAVPTQGGVALMAQSPMAPVWAGPAEASVLQQLAAGRPLSRHPLLDSRLLPEAEACPPELADGLRETLSALEDRPACPLARLPHFDHHLGVVTGWALARIGATLWPEETPPAILVLERFASLQVYVRRDEEGLAVRVPLGKRHADLSRTGLLADVSRVPWLFGGSIRFRGA